MTTVTHTRTFNVINFADPYKKCLECGQWVDGFIDGTPGPVALTPCEHRNGYRDLCPSWGPVDGCECAEYSRRHPDKPISHSMRTPTPGDGKTY